MNDSTTWWLLAGVALGSGAIASAAALSDSVRARWRARQRRRLHTGAGAWAEFTVAPASPLPIASDVPAPLAPAVPAAATVPTTTAPTTTVPATTAPLRAQPDPVPATSAPTPAPPATPPAPAEPATPPEPTPRSSPPPAHGIGRVEAGAGRVIGRVGVSPDRLLRGSQHSGMSTQISLPPTTPAPVLPLIVGAATPPPPAQPTPPSGQTAVAAPPPADAMGGVPPVEVRVLGPFEVRAPGLAGQHREPLAALITMAAVFPMGVPQAVVGRLLPDADLLNAAAQQARGWLGTDDAGQPRLREQDGSWHLSPDVWVDWRAFRDLVAPSASDDDPRRLAEALALIRGELLAGLTLPPVAQEMLGPVVDEIRAAVVSAVEREMLLALAAADSDRAGWALRRGLLLLPREGALWRLQLQL